MDNISRNISENIWSIYGLSSIVIVLISVFTKPKRDTLRKVWLCYGVTPVLIVFLKLLFNNSNTPTIS
jgi:uncharacterized membrane protein YjdF